MACRTRARIRQVIAEDHIGIALDQEAVTLGTVGILPIPHLTRSISRVDVVQAGLCAYFRGSDEGFRRRVIRIRHVIIFVQAGHMPGKFRRDAVDESSSLP